MNSTLQIICAALKHTFWDVYDHLGMLIIANLLAILFCFPVVTAPLAFAGIFSVASRIVSESKSELRVRDFFAGMAHLWRRFYLLAAIQLAVCAFGSLNVWFYLSVRKEWLVWGMIAAGLCFWLTIFFLLGQLFVVPLVCRNDLSLRRTFRLGYWLMMKNIGIAVLGALYVLLIGAILLISGTGMILLGFVFPAIFVQNCSLQVAVRSRLIERGRMEEKRTLRDLLRPWDID